MTRCFHISFSEAYYCFSFSLCCEVYQEKRDLQGTGRFTDLQAHIDKSLFKGLCATAAILRNVNTLILV